MSLADIQYEPGDRVMLEYRREDGSLYHQHATVLAVFSTTLRVQPDHVPHVWRVNREKVVGWHRPGNR